MIRAITPEARLAEAFLTTLETPRAPWAERFDLWASERGLHVRDASVAGPAAGP